MNQVYVTDKDNSRWGRLQREKQEIEKGCGNEWIDYMTSNNGIRKHCQEGSLCQSCRNKLRTINIQER